MATRLEKTYITRLTNCLTNYFETDEYTDMIIIVVPLLKASNNKEETMKLIEEKAIQYKNKPKGMLSFLKSLAS